MALACTRSIKVVSPSTSTSTQGSMPARSNAASTQARRPCALLVTASGKAQPANTEDVLTASVALYDLGTTKAAASHGTHQVEVTSLATAHKLIADTSPRP
ncbi:hypothetical protein G6F24_017673 [Rhizopus arrhizus]|nr:hypothetical protein G6F24_017673 [Rhizopus arrhizus]